MTLDDAIKHCEEKTEALYKAIPCDGCAFNECAEEHRQLAEWLKELKRWREFGRNNAQFIKDCLIQNRIDELYSSEIKNDADILRIDNEVLTLRTTNEFCKSFNERYERWEREQNERKAES